VARALGKRGDDWCLRINVQNAGGDYAHILLRESKALDQVRKRGFVHKRTQWLLALPLLLLQDVGSHLNAGQRNQLWTDAECQLRLQTTA
jgi:hypothetical protein